MKRRICGIIMEEDMRKQGMLYLQQQRFGKVQTVLTANPNAMVLTANANTTVLTADAERT